MTIILKRKSEAEPAPLQENPLRKMLLSAGVLLGGFVISLGRLLHKAHVNGFG